MRERFEDLKCGIEEIFGYTEPHTLLACIMPSLVEQKRYFESGYHNCIRCFNRSAVEKLYELFEEIPKDVMDNLICNGLFTCSVASRLAYAYSLHNGECPEDYLVDLVDLVDTSGKKLYRFNDLGVNSDGEEIQASIIADMRVIDGVIHIAFKQMFNGNICDTDQFKCLSDLKLPTSYIGPAKLDVMVPLQTMLLCLKTQQHGCDGIIMDSIWDEDLLDMPVSGVFTRNLKRMNDKIQRIASHDEMKSEIKCMQIIKEHFGDAIDAPLQEWFRETFPGSTYKDVASQCIGKAECILGI